MLEIDNETLGNTIHCLCCPDNATPSEMVDLREQLIEMVDDPEAVRKTSQTIELIANPKFDIEQLY